MTLEVDFLKKTGFFSLERKRKCIDIDAMGCQKEIARQIIERKADYVLEVKGNQGNLYAEIVNFFDQAESADFEYIKYDRHKSYEESRGRQEERILFVVEEINWLPMQEEWKGLRSIACLISHREIDGKKATEKRYYSRP